MFTENLSIHSVFDNFEAAEAALVLCNYVRLHCRYSLGSLSSIDCTLLFCAALCYPLMIVLCSESTIEIKALLLLLLLLSLPARGM